MASWPEFFATGFAVHGRFSAVDLSVLIVENCRLLVAPFLAYLKARSKRRSIHAPNLTDELSTAEERRLN